MDAECRSQVIDPSLEETRKARVECRAHRHGPGRACARRAIQGILMIGMLVAGPVLTATTILRLSLVSLVDQADLIFVGRSIGQQVVPTRDGKFPFTFVTFTVEQVLKGSTEERTLTLRLAGGQIGNRTVEVVGMPEFQREERYLIFVTQNGTAGCPILGWSQGLLQFTQDSLTSETILTDAWGAPIQGISGDDWLRGTPRFTPKPGVVYSSPSTSQLEPAPGVAGQAGESGTAADRLLIDLRALIARRQGAPGFRAAPAVRSALASEVPERMGGTFVAPGPANPFAN